MDLSQDRPILELELKIIKIINGNCLLVKIGTRVYFYCCFNLLVLGFMVRWLESLFSFWPIGFISVGRCVFLCSFISCPVLYFGVPMAGPLVIHRVKFDLFTYVCSYFYFECCVQ
jgi:hypothetical protein